MELHALLLPVDWDEREMGAICLRCVRCLWLTVPVCGFEREGKWWVMRDMACGGVMKWFRLAEGEMLLR